MRQVCIRQHPIKGLMEKGYLSALEKVVGQLERATLR